MLTTILFDGLSDSEEADFTAQETLTLASIKRNITVAHVNRILEPEQIKRTAEVE